MKLPVIRSLAEFIAEHDESDVESAIKVLEHVSQARGLKEEELDTIVELLSNMYGSIDVAKAVKEGAEQKVALNDFMKRVMGSIDR